MKQNGLHLIILVAISTTVFFTNLGQASLWDRDEPRNAGCAAEMMARGDWVVPTFNDELRHQKPVLLYWLIISAYTLFGQNEFAARFWSAMLAVGTVLATYGIGRRLASPRVGLLAGIVLSTSLMFDVAARAATPDSVLIFCGSVAFWIYVWGTFASREEKKSKTDGIINLRFEGQWFPQNYLVVVSLYAMLGLGVLAKGPVGFLLPMAIIGMFALIHRLPEESASPNTSSWIQTAIRLIHCCLAPFHPKHFLKTLWSMRPLTGAVVILVIAAPWYLLVDARTEGHFTRLFFLGEHFGRATTAMENHSGGIWYYPATILVGFFPWSIFFGPLVVMLFAQRRIVGQLSTLECFAFCWIAIQVGAFSIAQTKLPSYVTPCYPALALLTANFLAIWVSSASSLSLKWMYGAYGALIFGGLVVTAGLGIAANMLFPDQIWLFTIGLIPVVGGAWAIWQLTRKNQQHVLVTTIVTSFLFCLALFGFGTGAVSSEQNNQTLLKYVAAAGNGQVIASFRSLESSWIYYGAKPIYECDNSAEDRRQISSIADFMSNRHRWQPKPKLSPEQMLQINPTVMFITTNEHYPELQKRIPHDFEVIETADYFLRDKQIVLVGRRASTARRNSSTSSVILSR